MKGEVKLPSRLQVIHRPIQVKFFPERPSDAHVRMNILARTGIFVAVNE